MQEHKDKQRSHGRGLRPRHTQKGGAASPRPLFVFIFMEKVSFSLLFDTFSMIFGFWATGRPYLAEDFLSTFQNYPKCVRRPLAV